MFGLIAWSVHILHFMHVVHIVHVVHAVYVVHVLLQKSCCTTFGTTHTHKCRTKVTQVLWRKFAGSQTSVVARMNQRKKLKAEALSDEDEFWDIQNVTELDEVIDKGVF